MKKILGLCLFLAVTGCVAKPKEERFVNPIFYSLLEGPNYQYDTIKITPTSYFIRNYFGYYTMANCEMLENTMEKVKLKCLYLPADSNNKEELVYADPDEEPLSITQEFVISKDKPFAPATSIVEYSYFRDEEKWSERHAFVTVNTPSRKWDVDGTIAKARAMLEAKTKAF